ncbi:UDP-3-O-[3-hydroxymyristoyl] N-acetylglucosamine deacetylase [hydrothermal vent metagenome]|uniref:UDP-3-O-acyl-N-acetylglucosamine deacetylase n=1 Tax=hydrothermal vent metagenome TaxID=652676 RepID=A0A3B1DNQ8_9ZZZZ
MKPFRSENTIQHSVEVGGVGFFTNSDITVRFHPAPPLHGISFSRIDLPGSKPIPALLEYAVFRERRTALQREEAVVELTEHVLAALAGLQIDNCLIEIDAPELPGGDGSAMLFVNALLQAGKVNQQVPRKMYLVEQKTKVSSNDSNATVVATPNRQNNLQISYTLDYGQNSPVPSHAVTLNITPETFINEIAFARTFVLEKEVAYLKAAGYGKQTTARDLLVFKEDGSVIDNSLHRPDECARHKILDCIGDFALMGCDIHGTFQAIQSGHQLNREMVNVLQKSDHQKKYQAA